MASETGEECKVRIITTNAAILPPSLGTTAISCVSLIVEDWSMSSLLNLVGDLKCDDTASHIKPGCDAAGVRNDGTCQKLMIPFMLAYLSQSLSP